MGKRLFVAVDIDPSVRQAVGRISEEVRQRVDPLMKLSWVKPDRMHLTLHFFGQVESREEERISRTLAQTIPLTPFDLSFEGLGAFPERGSPRVLWIGIGDGAAALEQLHQIVSRRLELPTENEFHPHLTLARYRDRVRRPEISQILAMPAAAGPTRIDRVTLYESRLSPTGPTYLRLAEAPLTS